VTRDPVDALVLDLIEWLGDAGQSYTDAMERWRTSCPRLDVWERAMRDGLIRCKFVDGAGLRVLVTEAGHAQLLASRITPIGAARARRSA
jgi:D-3-phosphoglycerate dehydrogenase